MSFKYETQHNSPNFTAGADAPKTWGRAYKPTHIAIHWWGDPNTGPTYEGVIATLVNPNRGASAHFVATGTGRRVAQLIDLSNASWATNSANPYTISIECDPRCREEDYDVVAELIANIRSALGDLPLVPHRQFVATQCPGNYNLAELDRRARLKDGSGDWGDVKTIGGDEDVKILQPAVFNKEYYLKVNPDLVTAKVDPAAHWQSSGAKEGRNANASFSVREYLENYDDLRKAFGTNYIAAIEHYVNNGISEGRAGTRAKLAKQKEQENALKELPNIIKQLNEVKALVAEKDETIKKLQAEIDSKPTETSPEGPKDGDGTTNPSEPTKPTQSISERLKAIWQEILKFINS